MKQVVLASVVLVSVACSRGTETKGTSIPTYDPTTGKLTKLTADLSKRGKPDTWTYMNGAIPIRTEQDRDGDGKVDRWEYLDEAGKLASAKNSPDGNPDHINRWETYKDGILVLVEEDTNGDGRPDKWEKHNGAPIVSVEFDINFDGVRDQRWTYGPGGTVTLIESQPDGRGGYIKRMQPGK